MLIPENAAAAISNAYAGAVKFPPSGDYPLEFATAYDAYASDGNVAGAINVGGEYEIIEAELRAGPTTSDRLGKALSEYWATVAVTPAPGNASATNDALAKEPLFVAAVENSITGVESNPPFENFVRTVEEEAVRAVTWVVATSSGATTAVGIV